MGGLTLATFLGRNQWLANKVAGVMYSAPWFGVHENSGVDFAKKAMTGVLAGLLDEFAVVAPLPIHKVCKSKARSAAALPPAPPFASCGSAKAGIKLI